MYQDQAVQLRRMVDRFATQTGEPPATGGATGLATEVQGGTGGERGGGGGRVLAVTSGKGGVGKTNISVNLSARLSQMGRRVLMLDADLGLANADVVCNLNHRSNLAHVVAGRKRLAEAVIDAPGGFKLIPGASGLAGMASLSAFERARIMQELQEIEMEHDWVVIDTGAGVSPNVLNFLTAADEVLLVTTPEPTAVTDAYALIKAASRQASAMRINLLVNMARDRREGRGVYDRITAVSRRFLELSPVDAGCVLMDPKVGRAVRRRAPFVLDSPRCSAGVCVKQLAHKLDSLAAEPRHESFFHRFASWIRN